MREDLSAVAGFRAAALTRRRFLGATAALAARLLDEHVARLAEPQRTASQRQLAAARADWADHHPV
jgi:hypothetical protein